MSNHRKLGWIRGLIAACMLGAVLFGVARCHGGGVDAPAQHGPGH